MEVRRQNRNRVYRQLTATWEPITKQDLATQLSMSLPTLTQNLNELAELGLIDRSVTTLSTGGRRPRLIMPLADARFAVGVEVTSRDLRLAAVNLQQKLVAYQKVELSFSNTECYGGQLAGIIEDFLDENKLDRERLLGIGVTLPGIIGPDQNTIEYAPTIGVHTPVPCRFIRAIRYHTRLDNDANCGGFGEWWNRTDQQSMAYLSLSRGVGGALLLAGELYDGVNHRAAEFGHICLHPGGRLCECGRQGCLEAYCSSARLSDDLGITLEAFFQRLEEEDPRCQAIWQDYLENLATAVTTIHTILDCPVMIGGAVSQFLPRFRVQLERRIRELDPLSNQAGFVTLCPVYSRSVCIGAAMRLLYEFVNRI